jgi:hypothetical protein
MMPSKHKLRLERDRRRRKSLLHEAERRKEVQESAKTVLADVDRLIDRLAQALVLLQKTRKTVLIQAIASIKNKTF